MNGEGTQASPYQVTTADEFIEAIQQDKAYVEILNDLDFNNSKYWNIKTTTSVPASNTIYPEHAFEFNCSNINGNNFKISNILNLFVHSSNFFRQSIFKRKFISTFSCF